MRLIGEEGEQYGILPTFEAMRTAQEKGLDLVEVAPTAVPPVCRLMDYGRFKYEQTKKEREARKNQKVVELKEVRMTPRTDEHDIVAKVKSIHRFLEDGDKVKVTIRFRGRELAHPQLGRQVLEEVAKNLTNGVIERPPMFEGKSMFMIVAPPGSRPPAGVPRPPQGMGQAPMGPGPMGQAPMGQPGMPNAPVPAGAGPRPPGPPQGGPPQGGLRPGGPPPGPRPAQPPNGPGAGPRPMGPGGPRPPGPPPGGPRPYDQRRPV